MQNTRRDIYQYDNSKVTVCTVTEQPVQRYTAVVGRHETRLHDKPFVLLYGATLFDSDTVYTWYVGGYDVRYNSGRNTVQLGLVHGKSLAR